jgi:hypothetical protein
MNNKSIDSNVGKQTLSPDGRNPKLDASRKSAVSGKSSGSKRKKRDQDDEHDVLEAPDEQEYYDEEEGEYDS